SKNTFLFQVQQGKNPQPGKNYNCKDDFYIGKRNNWNLVVGIIPRKRVRIEEERNISSKNINCCGNPVRFIGCSSERIVHHFHFFFKRCHIQYRNANEIVENKRPDKRNNANKNFFQWLAGEKENSHWNDCEECYRHFFAKEREKEK